MSGRNLIPFPDRRPDPAAGDGPAAPEDQSEDRPERAEVHARTVPALPRDGAEDRAEDGAEVEAAVFDAEVIDDEVPPVPVDPPPGAAPWAPAWQRQAAPAPVIPPWLREPDERAAAWAWARRRVRHAAAFHAVRVPVYGARLARSAPRGLGRAVAGLAGWVADRENAPMRKAVLGQGADGAATYVKLLADRSARVRGRGTVAALAVAVVVAGLAAARLWAPTAAQWAVYLVLVAVLGRLGRRADQPIVSTRAVQVAEAPRLTSDQVVSALGAIGLSEVNQAVRRGLDRDWFVAPIARDGKGWRAELNLPEGLTVGEVADKRDKLAAALRRPLGCVWPEGNAEVHPGRLVLWVGDEDMSRASQSRWPLLATGRVDLFEPVPFGTDPRGRLVAVTLLFAAAVIGSVPRMGKTFAVRLLLLAAALDPRAELHLYDLKGTGDFAALEPVAHRYAAGDDLPDIEYAITDLRALREEMRRRTKVIRDLPRQVCPENKVTPELADRRTLGLWPILVAADECQRWFEHPEYGKEFTEICEDLVRRGPATGVITVFATQRPDAKSLPSGISDNAVLRFCLKVMGQLPNDMVLGTSMYRNGVRASMFSRRDKGIGYLVGEGDDPTICRTFYVDAPTAEAVITRARALREHAGTLTGHAIGQHPTTDRPEWTIVADALAVMAEDRLHSDVLCVRLAEQWPDRYRDLTPARLAAAGVPTRRQLWADRPEGAPANRAGVTREDLIAALEQPPG